jgi:hypothetical protein
MSGSSHLAQVVQAMQLALQMLGPLQPAWILARSKWSKMSKHLLKLVNEIRTAYFLSSRLRNGMCRSNFAKKLGHLGPLGPGQ